MENIIRKLASKQLSFGCLTSEGVYLSARLEENRPNTFSWPHYILGKKGITGQNYVAEILGHPVYKHHVEKYLRENGILYQNLEKLTLLWEHFNFEKSIQQIAEKSGYEEVAECECQSVYHIPPSPAYESCWELHRHILVQRLKDPNARTLEQFISNLIL